MDRYVASCGSGIGGTYSVLFSMSRGLITLLDIMVM